MEENLKGRGLCNLCPRKCGSLGNELGVCGETNAVRVARAALHFWEEPVISGKRGSGAVFFSGCNLHCVYCQNAEISSGLRSENRAKSVTIDELKDIFLRLMSEGALNINLVTPSHYVPQIATALRKARQEGLTLPVVYNTSSYDSVDELKIMDGLVDIYLADYKYMSSARAEKYSHAPDYREVAEAAIAEMVRQRGKALFYDDGIMKSGVIVRHLLLPGGLADAKKITYHLYRKYKDDIYFSFMNQYTPMPGVPEEINRTVTGREYRELINYAINLGIENAFVQDEGTENAMYIPEFDGKV